MNLIIKLKSSAWHSPTPSAGGPGPSQFPLECPWSLQTSDKHRQCPGRWTRMFRKRAMTKSMEFIGNYRSGKIFFKKLPPLFLTICRNAYGNSKKHWRIEVLGKWNSTWKKQRTKERPDKRMIDWLNDWLIEWMNQWTKHWKNQRTKEETHECIKWIEMDH